uniref:Mitogen-activated protein kinase kinase kinase kinase n=1 Tax=Oncorhynchus tshawytscha TaxID=74940 RepID=A0A8C8G9X5_ONCTS
MEAIGVSYSNPLEDYELIHRIGSGTYGDVFKARDIKTSVVSAIKVVKLDPGDDISSIQQEITMIRECTHKNIVAYFGSYFRNNKLWICMEYCGGGSLQDIYHGTMPLSLDFLCLQGLRHLHETGKMHRDIKVMYRILLDIKHVNNSLYHSSELNHLVWPDFGVAAEINASVAKRKSFIGTPYWMAPEVAAVEKKGGYNQLCDIWAVGITAIELAELQPPMFDLHPMRALMVMSKGSFQPPKLKDKSKWSVDFHSFVKVSLTKNPRKRPTAEKLLQHPFVSQRLTRTLAIELLDMASNPVLQTSHTMDECDLEVIDLLKFGPPMRKETDPSPDLVSSLSSLSNLCYMNVMFNIEKQCILFVDLSAQIHHPETLYCAEGSGQRPEKTAAKAQQPPLSPEWSTLRRKTEDSRGVCHGLPPTPKVHMGACFSKVFNGCPLNIHCAVTWVLPKTKDQHLILGTEEGIYTLNLNELHEDTMEKLLPQRCSWLYVMNNVLMSISGKSSQLCSQRLTTLFDHRRHLPKRQGHLSINTHRLTERINSRRFSVSGKIPDTKGCRRCSVVRNPYTDSTFLCAVVPTGLVLLLWYEPLQKFMQLKHIAVSLPESLPIFELLVLEKEELPQVCVGVCKLQAPVKTCEQVHFDIIHLNDTPRAQTGSQSLKVMQVTQMDRDTVLITLENTVEIVNLNGNPSKGRTSKLTFDFSIETLVCLQDSVLAFWKHGLKGRSLNSDEVTQEITDESRIFRVLGTSRDIILQSTLTDNPSALSNLYILTGHESSY